MILTHFHFDLFPIRKCTHAIQGACVHVSAYWVMILIRKWFSGFYIQYHWPAKQMAQLSNQEMNRGSPFTALSVVMITVWTEHQVIECDWGQRV